MNVPEEAKKHMFILDAAAEMDGLNPILRKKAIAALLALSIDTKDSASATIEALLNALEQLCGYIDRNKEYLPDGPTKQGVEEYIRRFMSEKDGMVKELNQTPPWKEKPVANTGESFEQAAEAVLNEHHDLWAALSNLGKDGHA